MARRTWFGHSAHFLTGLAAAAAAAAWPQTDEPSAVAAGRR